MAQSSLKLRMLEVFRFRMFSFIALVCVLLGFLIIQLINIQLIQGKEYRRRSRMNMESNIPIPAPRGEIYDRNFKPGEDNIVIVSNRPSFNISTIPARFNNKEEFEKTIKKLSKILKIPYEDIFQIIDQQNPWERIILKEDVPLNLIIKIASNRFLFPNIDWNDESVRVYNLGKIFFHTIGYVGSISKDEYAKYRDIGYKYYHKIGKTGIESEYDSLLRGIDGYVRRIVDVKNRLEGEEIGASPIAGNNLILTIDTEVQSVAYEAMEGLKGAVVAIMPATGEIIAIVSKPDIDPNLIISRGNGKIINALNNDKDRPFLNRAVQTKYPPASMFKLVTAISALEEDKWKPNRINYCTGKFTLKGYIDKDIYCYKTHGALDMEGAIAHSCSVYFYQTGLSAGPSIILKYANYLGLGEKTGIDIPGEITGFIPSNISWKLKTHGQRWYDGDTVNLSIGQGFISTTVIGIADFISGIVNNGVVYKPHVVKEIRSPDNTKVIKSFIPEKTREIPLTGLTMNTIKSGMRSAVKYGTAARLSYINVPIAGKTGTAQTRSIRKENYSQHAWFVSYAPYNGDISKAVAVVVLVEYGVAGAASAVPVAEKIYTKLVSLGYF
ncbi:MAG: penicillin-binding protein 2 [Spirochaetes bacterium]|nr:penicillin-binding protein 2 [Spirochaetota bacterium]